MMSAVNSPLEYIFRSILLNIILGIMFFSCAPPPPLSNDWKQGANEWQKQSPQATTLANRQDSMNEWQKPASPTISSNRQDSANDWGVTIASNKSSYSKPSTPQENTEANDYKQIKPDIPPVAAFGKYYALVIGIDNYKFLPKLKTAKYDSETVAGILKNDYGFTVQLLPDARRADIINALAKYRELLTKQDNLLIYYAGHGWLDREGDEGYWLPVDATKQNELNWVSNSYITTTLKAMEAT